MKNKLYEQVYLRTANRTNKIFVQSKFKLDVFGKLLVKFCEETL